MDFKNTYQDDAYAAAYGKLEFPGTYYLAFRDLPDIISCHVSGKKALDVGCGTGRSTRFLRNLGFGSVGVDIAGEMVDLARKIDSSGDYRLIQDGELSLFPANEFDLVLSAFTFDNIPTQEKKVALFTEMARILKTDGRIINLVSSPDIYLHEWASFSTKDYPENHQAKMGDTVRIIVTAIDDKRPVIDVLWADEDYSRTYSLAGLRVVDKHSPLGKPDEPFEWINETKIAPWTIYVLAKI